MSELTPEERALLEGDVAETGVLETDESRKAAARRPRPERESHRSKPVEAAPAVESKESQTQSTGEARGPHTPPQFDDDGWSDLPVQMRG